MDDSYVIAEKPNLESIYKELKWLFPEYEEDYLRDRAEYDYDFDMNAYNEALERVSSGKYEGFYTWEEDPYII